MIIKLETTRIKHITLIDTKRNNARRTAPTVTKSKLNKYRPLSEKAKNNWIEKRII